MTNTTETVGRANVAGLRMLVTPLFMAPGVVAMVVGSESTWLVGVYGVLAAVLLFAYGLRALRLLALARRMRAGTVATPHAAVLAASIALRPTAYTWFSWCMVAGACVFALAFLLKRQLGFEVGMGSIAPVLLVAGMGVMDVWVEDIRRRATAAAGT